MDPASHAGPPARVANVPEEKVEPAEGAARRVEGGGRRSEDSPAIFPVAFIVAAWCDRKSRVEKEPRMVRRPGGYGRAEQHLRDSQVSRALSRKGTGHTDVFHSWPKPHFATTKLETKSKCRKFPIASWKLMNALV